jgi:hypothetical protein
MRLKGLGKLKNRMTSSVIEPTTLSLVAYCLSQLRNRVPQLDFYEHIDPCIEKKMTRRLSWSMFPMDYTSTAAVM